MFKSLYNSVRIFKNPTEKWASDLKQILTDLKGYMDSNAIIVRDSNTPHYNFREHRQIGRASCRERVSSPV